MAALLFAARVGLSPDLAEILQARGMDSMQANRVNTCLYLLIQLGSIGFSGRLTQPTPPSWGGGPRLLNRLAKTSQLGRCRRGAARCGMGWVFERLGCSSGGVGHFWGAFASVDGPGGA
jgi:hypothetical protein